MVEIVDKGVEVGDDKAELAAIAAELKRGDNLLPALKQLLDLFGRSSDPFARTFINLTTALIAKHASAEQARRVRSLSQSEFEHIKNDILRGSQRVIRMANEDAEAGVAPHTPKAKRPGALLIPSSMPVMDSAAVLHARGVSKTRQTTHFRLAQIDVKVMPGKVLGVVGVNGSGKSTLLDILRGEIASDTGVVDYPQLSASNQDWAQIRTQIGYVPQRSVPWSGNVRETLEYACALHKRYGETNRERVDMLVARHGLTAYQKHTWGQLSGGYRLRFDLVMARLHSPRLMIFDEPLANLDPVSQQMFLSDLVQLARGEGGIEPGIVLTSQHLYELENVASEVIVLSAGRRIIVPTERPFKYFEIWCDGLTIEKVKNAFCIYRPVDSAGKAVPWDIRMGQAACLVALNRETATIEKVTEAANAADTEGDPFKLSYVRDVTRSARVDLDALVDEPDQSRPQQVQP